MNTCCGRPGGGNPPQEEIDLTTQAEQGYSGGLSLGGSFRAHSRGGRTRLGNLRRIS